MNFLPSVSAHNRSASYALFVWFLFVIFPSSPLLLAASQNSQAENLARFDAANKAYEQGKYADATAAYEKIQRAGASSPALYFNLGNAYLKLNQTGRAIAAYKKARQLAPRDADVRANLEFARRQVQGPTAYRNLGERWLDWFSLNEWTMVTAVCVWVFFSLLAIRQFMPHLRFSFRVVVPVFGIASLLLSGCLAILYHERSEKIAIVVTDVAIAHHGPLDESPAAFTTHDGAELRTLDTKGDWFQVTADSRRIGWLRRTDALIQPQL
jgi:tetratricopeptide (TPR) repeat protein